MKKNKRRPNWGEQWALRNRTYTLVDLRLDTWFSTPENAAFVVERTDLARVYDRRDANRMYYWMRRGTSLVERVRAQLAHEGAGA